MARNSSGLKGTIGMLLPGLSVCGSAIQAASEPRVVSRSPAAMYLRLNGLVPPTAKPKE